MDIIVVDISLTSHICRDHFFVAVPCRQHARGLRSITLLLHRYLTTTNLLAPHLVLPPALRHLRYPPHRRLPLGARLSDVKPPPHPRLLPHPQSLRVYSHVHICAQFLSSSRNPSLLSTPHHPLQKDGQNCSSH